MIPANKSLEFSSEKLSHLVTAVRKPDDHGSSDSDINFIKILIKIIKLAVQSTQRS